MKHFLAAFAAFCALVVASPIHAQGAALVQPSSVVSHNCAGWYDTVNQLGDSGVGCWNHVVTLSDGSHGTATLAPTSTTFPNSAALINMTPHQPFYFMKGTGATGTDAGDYKCYRDANYVGGTFGYVNSCLTVYGIARAGSTSFEWPLLAQLDNYGTAGDLSQNVAAYFQARKLGTGSTWGAVTEIYDQTPNPTTGSITDEHDMSAVGTDVNNARVMLDMFARNPFSSVATEVGWGIRLNTDANTTVKNGITFNGNYINGINFAPATITSAAIILGDGHAECYDSACQRKKFFSSGVTYQSVPTLGNVFSWSDAGLFTANSVNAGSTLYMNLNGKICLDGATCSTYIFYDGLNIQFFKGTAKAVLNMTTGLFDAAGGFQTALTPAGVTCSGISTATITVNGGIVTHC